MRKMLLISALILCITCVACFPDDGSSSKIIQNHPQVEDIKIAGIPDNIMDEMNMYAIRPRSKETQTITESMPKSIKDAKWVRIMDACVGGNFDIFKGQGKDIVFHAFPVDEFYLDVQLDLWAITLDDGLICMYFAPVGEKDTAYSLHDDKIGPPPSD